LIITLVFEKNAKFFAENRQKSQKIVIITSTPGHSDRKVTKTARDSDSDNGQMEKVMREKGKVRLRRPGGVARWTSRPGFESRQVIRF
jgi:hypothetical protein